MLFHTHSNSIQPGIPAVMNSFRALIAAIVCLAISLPAAAHAFAVFTTYSQLDRDGSSHSVPASAVAFIAWGHKFPVDETLDPERMARYALIAPDGSEEALAPAGPGFLAVEFTPEVDGPHIVAAALENGFYTWHEVDGVGQSHHGPKTGLSNVVYSSYFEMRGKALVGVGRTAEDAFDEPIGDTLEIVPLENPLRKTGGAYQTLKVKVLFRGEPLADARVNARHQGHYPSTDFTQGVTTDADGVATIDLTHKGAWVLMAEHEIEPRQEFEEMCDVEHYLAALSFEVP